MFSRNQIMNTSFDPLHLVNTYGAFGTVGRERLNVVFEGTHADVPDETAEWKAYSYKGLPVDPGKMPPQVAPYQLRLDWQMWFASMSIPTAYPWVFHLIWKLLHNDANALGLFASNPFPNNPAQLYSSCPVSILLRQARERAGRVVEPRKTRTLAAAAFRGRPAPRLAAPSGGLAEPR